MNADITGPLEPQIIKKCLEQAPVFDSNPIGALGNSTRPLIIKLPSQLNDTKVKNKGAQRSIRLLRLVLEKAAGGRSPGVDPMEISPKVKPDQV